jgi:hypothetical protein
MLSVALAIIYFLIGVCVIFGLYHLILWVFGQIGVPVPAMAVKVVMVILVLVAIAWLIMALFGGGGFSEMSVFPRR